MSKLRSKQKKVMDGLFEGRGEDEVLADNNISHSVFRRWVREDAWIREFERRISAAYRQAEIIIAAYKPLAAAKLVALTECDKEQTARQACLDVIQMPRAIKEREEPAEGVGGVENSISDEVADKLIEVLVGEKQRGKGPGSRAN